MHDPLLRDNPPAPPGPRTRPFDYQLRRYNQSHPDIPVFLARLRALLDSYGATFSVAEVGGDDPIRTRADGAVAWRASLQVKTASARRIHYWALPNQRIELARIALHDDYDI